MLESYLTVNPALYNQCIKFLKEACREAEQMYRTPKDSFGFRFFRPDDPGIDGETDKYTGMYYNNKEIHLLGSCDKNHRCVPICNTWVYFGWTCNVNLGNDGYLEVKYNGVIKSKINAQIVYTQQYPQHMYLDVQHFRKFYQNDDVEFITYNGSNVDIIGKIHPILYRISSKHALNLQGNVCEDDNNFIVDYSKINDNMDVQNKSNVNTIMLKSVLKKLEQYDNPIQVIKIKDAPFTEHHELRCKIDPNHKSFLEALHNGVVCEFCGTNIKDYNSKYCDFCGVPLTEQKKIKKDILIDKIKGMV